MAASSRGPARRSKASCMSGSSTSEAAVASRVAAASSASIHRN
ncbi:hypothetical protein [Archangium minus]